MSYAQSVAIGPEFFGKAFHDYSDRYWAFAREILQNSIDCGSKRIEIHVLDAMDGDSAVAIVRNDGEPMTEAVLVGKLLSLGSSGKDFKDSVGGFGKAKEILYFAHRSYSVASGSLLVEGGGAGYNIARDRPFVGGTRSTVVWEGSGVGPRLRSAFADFIGVLGAKVKLTINGVEKEPGRPKLEFIRDLERYGDVWAKAYRTRDLAGEIVVRVDGVPMFRQNCDFRRGIVLELQGPGSKTLTSNRDGLRWPYSGELSALVTQLAVDRQSAFKLEKAVYTRFEGSKLRRTGRDGRSGLPVADAMRLVAARADVGASRGCAGIAVEVEGRSERKASFLTHEFIVKNCVRRAVPEAFDPDSLEFGEHATWLVGAWARCLLDLHELCKADDAFSVGFVFSEDVEAEFERSTEYGSVYFLNPCVITRRRASRRFTKSDRGRIAAIAAHEFVHGGLAEGYHGEDYANKLTDLMGLVCQNWRRFARHFK